MADFSGVDFLRLDDTQLSEEERLVRDSVRDWVSKEFLPRLQEHIRQDGSFPMDLVPQIAELGMFGANLKGYGCAGMNNVAYGLLMQELERGDSGLRSFASVQGSLCMYPIHSYGSEEQRERWERASPTSRVHADAPPFLVIHGTHDSFAFVEDAREFVRALRDVSRKPVVYAELPGAQHAFDIFHSPRSRHAVNATARFLEYVRSGSQARLDLESQPQERQA